MKGEGRGTKGVAEVDSGRGFGLPEALGEGAADRAREDEEGELEKRVEQHELILMRPGDGSGGTWNIQLIPPLMEMTWPVIYAASSEARKPTKLATSSPLPARLLGTISAVAAASDAGAPLPVGMMPRP